MEAVIYVINVVSTDHEQTELEELINFKKFETRFRRHLLTNPYAPHYVY